MGASANGSPASELANWITVRLTIALKLGLLQLLE